MPPKVIRGILRSDGTPNFSSAVFSKPKELEYIIQKPVFSATSRSPIIRGIEIMISKSIRRIPITDARGRLEGIVTATDMVNFFGGGEYYNIVKMKYGGRFFSALYAPLDSIMSKATSASIDSNFSDVLAKMINENVGAVPIVDKESVLVGIITEYDVIRYLSGRVMTERVSDYMTRNPLMASSDISIKSAARLMTSNGFRRIPIVKGDTVVGIVASTDIVKYIGEGSAFRRVLLDEMDQVLSAPVSDIMRTGVVLVKSDLQLGEVAPLIRTSGVGAVLVEDGGSVIGILTERDLLTALAIE